MVAYTLLLNYTTPRIAILAMTALLLLLLEIEYVRLEHRPKIAEIFDSLFRRHEKTRVSGAVFLVIACVISFSAFDYWIAFLAVSMAVFGDLAAAIIGQIFGKTKFYKNKTYVGTLACLVMNIVVGLLTLPSLPILIFGMAVTATLFEAFTRKLDDNLTVPLFAGFVGQMVVYFFGFVLPPITFTFFGLFN